MSFRKKNNKTPPVPSTSPPKDAATHLNRGVENSPAGLTGSRSDIPFRPQREPNRVNPNATASLPDVSQLAAANLPTAMFLGGRKPVYRIYYDPDLHARLWKHASENLTVEICGVLVGSWGKDDSGPFVSITESIRGEAATNKFAEVTFTHETWAKINQEMDTRFAKLSIVGWYHTHPDFGIFLSDRDVFIQQHFFSNPGNVALVIDPIRKTEGTFTWQAGKPALATHYWVGDKIQIAGASTCLESTVPAAISTPTLASSTSPPLVPDSAWPVRSLTQILAYLCLFLLGYFIASRLTDFDRTRLEQDAVARAALVMGVKPGLSEALDRCQGELSGLSRDADSLAKEHQKSAGDGLTDQQKEQWQTLRSGLAENRRRLAELRVVYGMKPAETQRILNMAAESLANANSARLSSAQRNQLQDNLEKLLRQLIKQGLIEPPEDAAKDKDAKDKETKDKEAKDKEAKDKEAKDKK